MENKSNKLVIDAVIPWVNGNDKNWQEKINSYLETKIDFKSKKESVRYNSIGEIDIAIKSIVINAPFINTIFLVTDNQIPENFDSLHEDAKKANINLELIDHKIIFEGFEEFLPTFNSTSIISLLHKIPNLSEHYIIFNDDTFVMRKTKIEDFFVDNYPVLRGKWKKYYEYQKIRLLYNRLVKSKKKDARFKKGTLKQSMQAGAKLAYDGKKVYLRRYHTPIAIRKSSLDNFFNKNLDLLKNNIKYRFRHNNKQFITETLANHLEIKNSSYYHAPNIQLTYFRSYKNYFITRLKLFLFEKNKNKLFITFQSLELADKKTLDYILTWIEKRL